jgi:hypothetical protein
VTSSWPIPATICILPIGFPLPIPGKIVRFRIEACFVYGRKGLDHALGTENVPAATAEAAQGGLGAVVLPA